MPSTVKIGYVTGRFSGSALKARMSAIQGRIDDSIDLRIIETDEAMGLRNWTPVDTAAAEGAYIAAFRKAESLGCQAVIPDGMLDLGVEAGRSAVGIPVVAPFQAALHMAACLGSRIGIVHYTRDYVPVMWAAVRKYGMLDFVVDIAALAIEMVDLADQAETVKTRTVAVARKLIADRSVDVIIPSGPGLCPVSINPAWLADEIGAPVVEGIGAPIHLAAAMIRLKLTQSAIRWPPARDNADPPAR